MAGIRIDALPTTVLPSKEHVFPAMKDGLSVQLSLEQVAAVMLSLGLIDANTAQTLTNKTLSAVKAMDFGSVLAASATDLSKHIALFSTTHGFAVTANRINYVAPTGVDHIFRVNTVDVAKIGGSGLVVGGPTGGAPGAGKVNAVEVQQNGVRVASSAELIGVGQTWSQPTRTAGTTYQNTTGRPIMVAISGYKTAFNFGMSEVSADGTTWVPVCNLVGDSSARPFSYIVPVNFYYRVETGTVINTWRELR